MVDCLPSNWAITKITDIGSVITGNTPPTKNANNYGNYIAFVKPPELVDDFITSAKDFLSEQGSQVGRVLPPYSILVSCIGNLGKTGINKVPVAFNQQINAIVPYEEILSTYIFYQTQSHNFRSQLESKSTATTVSIVNKGNFETVQLNIAPLNEQRRIVAKIEGLFGALDAGVASLKLAQAQLKTYRQALLKHAFEGKLTAEWREENADKLEPAATLLQRIQTERQAQQEEKMAAWQAEVATWEANGKPGKKPRKPRPLKTLPPLTAKELAELPELPAGWAWIKLVSIADLVGGVTKGKKLDGKKTVSLPYLRVANVQDGYLDLSEIKLIDVEESDAIKYQLEAGDVLYTEGGDKDKLGRGTVWQNQIANCIHQNHIFRARLPIDMINSEVIAFFSQTREAKRYFFKHGKQTTNLASINLTVLSNLPVPIQSPLEQQQILQQIKILTSVLDQLEKTITIALQQAKALRQSILKKAFAGQLVPQDPSDEPASVLLSRIRATKESSS